MKITIVTLFPDMITAFFNESIIKRAQEKGHVEIEVINLRDFAEDKYKTVDDRPYGGGAGMVIKADVVARALEKIFNFQFSIINKNLLKNEKWKIKNQCKVVLTSARGKTYNQTMAEEYSKIDHLVILAGHYEGFDERIGTFVDEEVTVGDFVLTGGEIPAAAIVDSVVRLQQGVLKKEDATQEESFMSVSVKRLLEVVGEDEIIGNLKKNGIKSLRLLEYPHYTRPEEFNGQKVPEILLSGDHKKIEEWRLKKAYEITQSRRPDLLRINDSA